MLSFLALLVTEENWGVGPRGEIEKAKISAKPIITCIFYEAYNGRAQGSKFLLFFSRLSF